MDQVLQKKINVIKSPPYSGQRFDIILQIRAIEKAFYAKRFCERGADSFCSLSIFIVFDSELSFIYFVITGFLCNSLKN